MAYVEHENKVGSKSAKFFIIVRKLNFFRIQDLSKKRKLNADLVQGKVYKQTQPTVGTEMKRKSSFFTDWNFKEILTVAIVLASVFTVLFVLILRLDSKVDSVRMESQEHYKRLDDRLYTISNQLHEMNGKLEILIDKKR